MRRNKYIVRPITILVSAVLFFCTIGVSVWIDKSNAGGQNYVEETKEYTLELPELGEVYLVNIAVVEWMQGEYSAKALYNELRERGRLDTPLPVIINYEISDLPAELSVVSQTVEVSYDKDFQDAMTVTVAPEKRRAEIYNLYTGMVYYYRVTVILSNGESLSAQGSFQTANTPRVVSIDGVRNCRDIGGYTTIDGKQVRQGLIYRGTELDGAISNKYIITEAGVRTMLEELKIRTEMDLRASNTPNAKDMLGETVKHNYYSFLSYSESFTDHGKRKIKEIFSELANEESYPMYFHCTYGADRTGTIFYLMEAILGFSEDDLYGEWEFSAFLVGGAFEAEMAQYMEELKEYEGDTMQEKVENFLLSIGVTPEEIDSFRNIMLEEQAA